MRRRRAGKAGQKRENSSAVRGADPPLPPSQLPPTPARLTALLRGASTADQWLNRTKAEQGSISNNYRCKRRQLAPRILPKTGQRAPGSGAKTHRGGNKARKVRKALTWSRRRSNFFQYWNIDPTSAAILGDIEEVFFRGCNKYVGWIPPSLNNITVAPQKKRKKRTQKISLTGPTYFYLTGIRRGGGVLLSSNEAELWALLDFLWKRSRYWRERFINKLQEN